MALHAVTIHYMSASPDHAPARRWYDLVAEQIAMRGWGIAELARRAKIGRPTIYGWRDGSDGKIQAAPVNQVADVLGIPRERALRLAGIIPDAAPKPPSPVSDGLRAAIEEHPDLDDAGRARVLAAIERQIAIERGGTEGAAGEGASGGATEPGQRHRPAS